MNIMDFIAYSYYSSDTAIKFILNRPNETYSKLKKYITRFSKYSNFQNYQIFIAELQKIVWRNKPKIGVISNIRWDKRRIIKENIV